MLLFTHGCLHFFCPAIGDCSFLFFFFFFFLNLFFKIVFSTVEEQAALKPIISHPERPPCTTWGHQGPPGCRDTDGQRAPGPPVPPGQPGWWHQLRTAVQIRIHQASGGQPGPLAGPRGRGGGLSMAPCQVWVSSWRPPIGSGPQTVSLRVMVLQKITKPC